MSDISLDLVSEINHHHALAQQFAGEVKRLAGDAVEHARKAGALLLAQRAQLKHGEWLPWLAANFTFTERTAQRYMRAAAPKSDMVTHSGKPKRSKAALERKSQLDLIRHRDDVVARVAYVVAELPQAGSLRDADRDLLRRLRDEIDQVLGGGK